MPELLFAQLLAYRVFNGKAYILSFFRKGKGYMRTLWGILNGIVMEYTDELFRKSAAAAQAEHGGNISIKFFALKSGDGVVGTRRV